MEEIEAEVMAFKLAFAERVTRWRNSQHPTVKIREIATRIEQSTQFVSRALSHPEEMSNRLVQRISAEFPEFRDAYPELRAIEDRATPVQREAGSRVDSEEARGVIDELLELVRSIEERLLRLRRNCT